MNYKHISKIFKAFCDENRLKILEMLQTGEKCGCVILEQLNITQPTLSHHMKILLDSGIVTSRKDGKWTHYKISINGLEKSKKILDQLNPRLNNFNKEGDCKCKL